MPKRSAPKIVVTVVSDPACLDDGEAPYAWAELVGANGQTMFTSETYGGRDYKRNAVRAAERLAALMTDGCRIVVDVNGERTTR